MNIADTMEGETSVVESDASARESDLAERNGFDSLTYVPTESEWEVSDFFHPKMNAMNGYLDT